MAYEEERGILPISPDASVSLEHETSKNDLQSFPPGATIQGQFLILTCELSPKHTCSADADSRVTLGKYTIYDIFITTK